MANKDRYTAEEVSAALIQARGLKSVAARNLNCDWNTVDRYVRTYATCKDALKIARDGVTDLAEGKLYQAINNGEPWAIALYLRTVGKERGYVERGDMQVLTELRQQVDVNVQVRVTREQYISAFGAFLSGNVLGDAEPASLSEPLDTAEAD